MSRLRRSEAPGASARRLGVWPLTTSFNLPPARRDDRGEVKNSDNDGRRSTAWKRRRGRGVSSRDSGSAAEGTPKGLARPRSDSAPKGARGRLRRRTVRLKVRAAERLQGATSCARGEATQGWTPEPRGHHRSDNAARCGRGGRPPQGAARRAGAGVSADVRGGAARRSFSFPPGRLLAHVAPDGTGRPFSHERALSARRAVPGRFRAGAIGLRAQARVDASAGRRPSRLRQSAKANRRAAPGTR